MKLSDFVADFLVEQRLKHVFILPGGGSMHLCDSVGRRKELNYVCCLHEQACAFAAEAYGEYNNDFGCALVTTGPGGTNCVTGVACAWIESSPVLFISGQVKRSDLIGSRGVRSMGPQEVDLVSVVRPITKYAVRVEDPEAIRYELEKALFLARDGRKGPVWVEIPLDVQASRIEPATLRGFGSEAVGLCSDSNLDNECEKALEALSKAGRPVIYAGNGIRTAGAQKVFGDLVKILGVPVLLTWKAADLLDDENVCYIGRPGAIGQRAANFTQQKADWLLVVGARLDLPSLSFNHENFAPKAYKIFVDIDRSELGKFSCKVDQAVAANALDFIEKLAEHAVRRSAFDFQSWRERCKSWVRRFPVVLPEHADTAGYISTYYLVSVLSELADADDLMVPGSSGPCSDIFMQAWVVKGGQRILNAPGLGAMGTGLPGSIGACLASGGRRTININGDGGFQLNIQELETVRRLNLPIKYFVLDNGGYRSIVAMQRSHFDGRLVASDPSSHLTLPDMARLGEAFGIKTFAVAEPGRLREVVGETLRYAGPAICVVKTSADEKTLPRATSEIRADGTIVTLPMEDMAPRWERDEFAAIMAE